MTGGRGRRQHRRHHQNPPAASLSSYQRRRHHATVSPARPPTPPCAKPAATPPLRTTYWFSRIWAPRLMAFCPRNVPQLVEIANFLSEGSAAPPMAIAIAVPSNACLICVCRVVTSPCRMATLFWRLEMLCGLKLVAARLPSASVVTNEVGPTCAARLAAEAVSYTHLRAHET